MGNLMMYKKMATKYFQGTISREEERSLLTFISTSKDNQDLFRKWEEEWNECLKSEEDDDSESDPYYSIFTEKRKTLSAELANVRLNRRMKLIQYVSIAAGIILIVGISLLLNRQHTQSIIDTESFIAINAPIGEKCQATLPDGSIVWLNADTRIRIPKSFGEKERKILLEGEAYFEVFKDTGKEFLVQTDGCNIVVHGTKFNVSAYPDDEQISTSVLEGNVEVVSKEGNVNLVTGQSARYVKSSSRLEVTNTNQSRNNAWVENRIDYKDITLSELSRVIARKYGKTIVFLSEKHKDERFNISLRNNESLDDLLTALKLIIHVDIQKEEDTIYIK